jgi:hypothetical protein
MKSRISKFLRKKRRQIRRFLLKKLLKKGIRKTHEDFDRLSWYIYKFGSSCGAFKEDPTKENLELLKKTTTQIHERLGIQMNGLLDVAERYMADPNTDLKIEFNELAKEFIMDMILSFFGKGEIVVITEREEG